MNPIYEKLEKCYQCVREKTDFVPEVAIIRLRLRTVCR